METLLLRWEELVRPEAEWGRPEREFMAKQEIADPGETWRPITIM